MQGTSAESVSANALMQTYYGEVLDETLNQTMRVERQPSLGQNIDTSFTQEASEAAMVSALREIKAQILPILKTPNPAFSEAHHRLLVTAVDAFEALKTVTFREWGETTQIWSVLTPKDFSDLLDLRLGVQMDMGQFTLNLKAYSQLLSLFENLYFSKAMVFKPRISSDQLGVSDPLFRQTVRAVNMRDAEVDLQLFNDQFNIKDFVIKCMTTFFPYVDNPVIGEETFAHLKTLRLVLMMFEYGLWTIDEMTNLLAQLYQCSTRLRNFERLFQGKQESGEEGEEETFVKKPTIISREAEGTPERSHREEKVEGGREGTLSAKVCRQLIQARILVAKILKHIVAMHFDFEVEVSFPNLGLHAPASLHGLARVPPPRTIGASKVFTLERMKKKRLYTYYSYILINYLLHKMPGPVLESEPLLFDKLNEINSSLLAFASNLKADFYLNSLLSLDAANIPCYQLSPHTGFRIDLHRIFLNFRSQMRTALADPGVARGRLPENFGEIFDGSLNRMTALMTNCRSLEEVKSLQIAFTLSRTDHLLLSALSNLLKSLGAERGLVLNPFIERAFDLLVLFAKDNLQCVNSFFSFYILKHFMALFERRPVHGCFLLMQLLRNRTCTKLFIVHEKVKAFVLEKLERATEELLNGLAGTTPLVDFEGVCQIVFLCKLTKSVIKENDGDSMRTSNQFSAMLATHFGRLLTALEHIQGASVCPIDIRFDEINQLETLVTKGAEIAATDDQHRQYLGLIAVEHLLGLFSAATRTLYRPEIHATVTAVLELPGGKLPALLPLIHSNLGIKIFRKYLKIYSNFRIFDQNCYMHNAFEKNLFDLYLIKTATASQISQDLDACMVALVGKFEGHAQPSPSLVKLVFKGCLPLVFKFITGFVAAYTDERFKNAPIEAQKKLEEICRTLEEGCLEVRKILETRLAPQEVAGAAHRHHRNLLLSFVADIQRQNTRLVPRKTLTVKIDGLKGCIFDTLSCIARMYLLRVEFFTKISQFYNFSETLQEEALELRMKACLFSHLKYRSEFNVSEIPNKSSSGSGISKKGRLQTKTHFLLESRGSCRPFNISLVRALDGTQPGADPFRVFGLPDCSAPGCRQVVNYYTQRYWSLKSESLDRISSNQIFRIFNVSDPIYQNTKVFVDFFVQEIQKIPLDLGSNSSSFFSLNQRYQTLFIFADNIFRLSAAYREYFIKVVRGKRFPGTLERLLNLRQMLFDQVAYKTFYNEAWNNLFVAYYLISCFVQTLCENNYLPFKELMVGSEQDGLGSKLAQYNQSIQAVVLESELHFKDKPEIDVSDRQCLDRVLCRAIEEINEFVTGGGIDPLPVYKTRVDIWSGILFRRDPDPDSSFYRIKYNIALYMLSFVESGNKEVLKYLSNKIFASDLLDECVYMAGLLCRKETPWLQGNYAPDWKDRLLGRSKARITGIPSTDKDVDGLVGGQPVTLDAERLLELYRTNQNGFSEHVIIDLLFTLFRFMRKLQEHDLRYTHFVGQLDARVGPALSRNDRTNEPMYQQAPGELTAHTHFHHQHEEILTPNQVVCWQFMSEVVCEVELQVLVKDETGKSAEQLVPYQFKKHPVCFFDTELLQRRLIEVASVESLEAKHEDFFNFMNKGIASLEIEQENHVRLGFVATLISDNAFDLYLFLMYLIALTINILCLVFYNRATEDFHSPHYGDATAPVIALTIVDAVLALALLGTWVGFKYRAGYRLQGVEFHDTYGANVRMMAYHKAYYYFYRAMLCDKYFICLMLHLGLSLLGLWTPFFYTLMLFLVLQFSSVLRGVCLAILLNAKRLFWSLVIIIVVINFFALLATEFFNNYMGDGYDNGCDSYFGCFLNSINVGVVQDGGIKNLFGYDGSLDSFRYAGLFFFKVIGFILVNLFLLGMFFGIITDAFSEYVADLTNKDEDFKTVCFCCGLKKHVLERYGITFKQHQESHAIFKYLYYVIYLRKLDVNSYTGIDYQVAKILKGNDKSAFLPKRTALALENKGVRLREDEKADAAEGKSD